MGFSKIVLLYLRLLSNSILRDFNSNNLIFEFVLPQLTELPLLILFNPNHFYFLLFTSFGFHWRRRHADWPIGILGAAPSTPGESAARIARECAHPRPRTIARQPGTVARRQGQPDHVRGRCDRTTRQGQDPVFTIKIFCFIIT